MPSESFSEKIDYLFKTVRRADGREFTYDDVERHTAGEISRSYAWKLRHGKNRNPSLDVLATLARFFKVPVTVFFESGHSPQDPDAVRIAKLLHNEGVRDIADRAHGMSPESQAIVAKLIDELKKLERREKRRARATAA